MIGRHAHRLATEESRAGKSTVTAICAVELRRYVTLCLVTVGLHFNFKANYTKLISYSVFFKIMFYNMKNNYNASAVKAAQEKKLDVAEIRMIRLMRGVTKLETIRNERIRGTRKVGDISQKVGSSGRYRHVWRREEEYLGRRVMVMKVPGKRRRERPKWLDNIRNDLSESELSREEAQDRVKW